MNRGVSRFIPMIFLLVIVALIIAAVISVTRIFFSSGEPTMPASNADTEALLATTESHKVRMTVRGQIVGDEDFRSYQVTVSPTGRDFVRYKGYLEKPLQTKHYSNNVKAYDEFVHALERANLVAGEPLTGDANDTRGVCASGVLYEFEVIDGEQVVEQLWTSSCKGSPGSLVADSAQLRELFLAQVPGAVEYIGKD